MRGSGGWRGSLLEAPPAVMGGLSSRRAGGEWQGVGRAPSPAGRVAGGALKVTQSNIGMHPTAGTPLVKFLRRGRRGG